ncbi:hypothetical protein [Microvirga sp. Mcv34]|uniref:hypothetical protein n=1 Tax=Microvirga sp. Mcv34 TaxID=2926016 RepID=UPI0021CA5C44|nr:hypothetical protein [Microvirga sp. Mcv34]
MKRLQKRKSNIVFRLVRASFVLLCIANPVHAVEVSGRFGTGPRIAQATAAGEPQARAQPRVTDAALCQDALGLYLKVSAKTFESKVAAAVLFETIARHETLARLISIATAAGCELRPFLDEEVRRSKP